MAHHHHHHDRSEKLPLGRLLFRLALAVVIVGLLVAYSMSFQVSEGYNAVVTRFGKPTSVVREAGLVWKRPWPIEQAHQIDMRRRVHNTPYSASFTQDRKNVVLLSYVVWRVEDPLLFLQSVGNREDAEDKLNGMIVDKKNFYLGGYDLSALVSTKSEEIKSEEIEEAILKDVADDAREKFGIRVEQVGIKRIAYPEENMTAVLQQMRAERKAEAGRLQAEGRKAAADIINDASVRRAELVREGSEKAGEIRGRAESEAAQIYDRAQQLDPEFYSYWKQLRSLKKILGEKATLILRTDQGPFKPLEGVPESLKTGLLSDQSPRPGGAAPAGQVSPSTGPEGTR
ncbi:MAG: protease modulator HflC [Planctomycetota bacterium]